MAGSKRWFAYTTDNGTVYGLNLDESNTEAVNGSVGSLPPSLIDALPRNISPRRAFYASSDGSRTISAVCLTPATYLAAQTTNTTISDPLSGGATDQLTLIRVTNEKRRFIRRVDTGLTDGDVEQAPPAS